MHGLLQEVRIKISNEANHDIEFMYLVEELKKEGGAILDKIETYDYGKFVHILDGEGTKIELWEPID